MHACRCVSRGVHVDTRKSSFVTPLSSTQSPPLKPLPKPSTQQAIVQFAGTIPSSTSSSTSSTDFVKLPLLELHVMARAFTPQCFFPDVALPLSPPEEAVPTDAATATASSVDGARTADKALDEQRCVSF